MGNVQLSPADVQERRENLRAVRQQITNDAKEFNGQINEINKDYGLKLKPFQIGSNNNVMPSVNGRVVNGLDLTRMPVSDQEYVLRQAQQRYSGNQDLSMRLGILANVAGGIATYDSQTDNVNQAPRGMNPESVSTKRALEYSKEFSSRSR